MYLALAAGSPGLVSAPRSFSFSFRQLQQALQCARRGLGPLQAELGVYARQG